MNFVRHYLLALQFFTRIPVTGRLADWVGYSPAQLCASAAHFPGVGWLVGAVAALGYAAVRWLLPDSLHAPLVAAVLSTVLTVLLTGAFHEDGLSDVADGLGGSHDRERVLEIMKDSRVGAFGVLAAVLALMSKVALLAVLDDIDPVLVCVGLFAAHVASRFLPLLLIRLLPYVGDTARSKSKPLANQISSASLIIAFVWLLMALALAQWLYPGIDWIAPLLAAGLAWLWMWRLFARRLQGYTGDCMGATQQVCELAFYFGLAAAA
jgi:adenosylcobinamide-GDP ribazoletransferase